MKPLLVLSVLFGLAIDGIAAGDDKQANSAKSQPSSGAKSAAATSQPASAHHRSTTSAKPRYNPESGSISRRNYPNQVQTLQHNAVTTDKVGANALNRPRVGNASVPAQPGLAANKPVDNNKPASTNKINYNSYADALKRSHHGRHDAHWWRQHCRTIVFVNTGYYYLDAGYWYPAYGYNPAYDYYDSDGPIYTYSNLLPDQVIANVQGALRDAGYYAGRITGSLNPALRLALTNFQRDNGLSITSAIDEPTVQLLGLI